MVSSCGWTPQQHPVTMWNVSSKKGSFETGWRNKQVYCFVVCSLGTGVVQQPSEKGRSLVRNNWTTTFSREGQGTGSSRTVSLGLTWVMGCCQLPDAEGKLIKTATRLCSKEHKAKYKERAKPGEKVEQGDVISEKLADKPSVKFHKPEFRYLLGLSVWLPWPCVWDEGSTERRWQETNTLRDGRAHVDSFCGGLYWMIPPKIPTTPVYHQVKMGLSPGMTHGCSGQSRRSLDSGSDWHGDRLMQ